MLNQKISFLLHFLKVACCMLVNISGKLTVLNRLYSKTCVFVRVYVNPFIGERIMSILKWEVRRNVHLYTSVCKGYGSFTLIRV